MFRDDGVRGQQLAVDAAKHALVLTDDEGFDERVRRGRLWDLDEPRRPLERAHGLCGLNLSVYDRGLSSGVLDLEAELVLGDVGVDGAFEDDVGGADGLGAVHVGDGYEAAVVA